MFNRTRTNRSNISFAHLAKISTASHSIFERGVILVAIGFKLAISAMMIPSTVSPTVLGNIKATPSLFITTLTIVSIGTIIVAVITITLFSLEVFFSSCSIFSFILENISMSLLYWEACIAFALSVDCFGRKACGDNVTASKIHCSDSVMEFNKSWPTTSLTF